MKRKAWVLLLALALALPAWSQADPLSWLTKGDDRLASGDAAGALAAYQKALEGYQAEGDLVQQAYTLECMTEAFEKLGQPEKAREARQQALALYEKALAVDEKALEARRAAGDLDQQAYTLGHMAGILEKLGRPEKALEAWQEALALYRQTGDASGQAWVLSMQSYLYQNLGRLPQALEACRPLPDLYAGLGQAQEQALALQRLGDLNQKAGQAEEALGCYRQAAALYAKLGDVTGQSLALQAAATLLADSGHTDEALAMLATLARLAKDPADQASAYSQMGSVYEQAGRLPEAVQAYRQALALYRKAGNREGEAFTLEALAFAQERLGQGAQASRSQAEVPKAHLDILARCRQKQDREGEALALSSLVVDCLALGRWEDALARQGELLDLYRSLGRREDQARGLSTQGSILLGLGRFEESLRAEQQALSLARELKLAHLEADCLASMGMVYHVLGDYAEALRAYREALDLSRSPGAPATLEALLVLSTAAVYDELGRWEEAVGLLEEWAAREKDPDNLILALWRRGELFQRLKEPARARAALEQARVLARQALARFQATDRSRYGTTLWVLGFIEQALGRPGEARRAFQESLEIHRALGDNHMQAAILQQLAELAAGAGSLQESLGLYRQAASLYEQVKDRPSLGRALEGAAQVYRRLGRGAEALQAVGRSIDLLESQAAELRLGDLKAAFMSRESSRYALMIRLLFEAGQGPQAFAYSERGRARAFLDSLGNARVNLYRGVSPELVEREQQLIRRIDALRLEMARGGLEVGPLEQEMERLQAEHARLVREISLLSPDTASLRTVQVVPADQIRRALPADTVLVEFFVGPEGLYAWALRSDGLVARRLEGGEEEVLLEVAQVRRLLSEPGGRGQVPRPGGVLARLVAFLTEQGQGKNTLLLVPHGALHYLPFAALSDGRGQRLVESWSIEEAPSASVWYYLRQRPPQEPTAARPLVAFALGSALPQAGAAPAGRRSSLSPLPGTLEEVRGLARLFPQAETYVEQAYNRQQVFDRAGRGRLVHFATHGLLDSRAPAFSSLVTADGFLSVLDVFKLRLNSQVVVLSACETALGELSRGDELVSLSRAFLSAGSRTVVASLWKVSDEATAQLMQAFYRHLQGGDEPAYSLRAAQLELARGGWADPYYWAGFVLYGDGGGRSPASP
ncbi:MAG TPA: CHAT domain-containing protein [Candidatus Nitrosotenuis sp.]|nr:CHAT domain-containing protein [Candidatus Nitrosotenuis sp.]